MGKPVKLGEATYRVQEVVDLCLHNESLRSRLVDDTANNIINDPWPSSFSSSGFDLDAIGVIHSVLSAKDIANKNQQIKVYPNPASTSINIHLIDFEDLILKIEIFNTLGQKIQTINANSNSIEINLEELPSGLYVLKANTKKDYIIVKQIIKK